MHSFIAQELARTHIEELRDHAALARRRKQARSRGRTRRSVVASAWAAITRSQLGPR